MIDVRFVAAHGLWILGLALILAAFSYYHWQAGETGIRRRHVLRHARGWKLSLAVGLLCIASGCILIQGVLWWQRSLWGLVWVSAAIDLWRLWRRS
jgi:uncharacterized membrane protein YidH (DUF202 family)